MFVILGGFIIIRFLIASPEKYVRLLIIGGLIFVYGIFRFISAYRNLRRLLKTSKEPPNNEVTR